MAFTTDNNVPKTTESVLNSTDGVKEKYQTNSSKINRPLTSKRNLPPRPLTCTQGKVSDLMFKNNSIQNIIIEDKGNDSSLLNENLKQKILVEKEIKQNIELDVKVKKDIFNLNPNKQNLYKIKLTKSNPKYKEKLTLPSDKSSTIDFEIDNLMKVEQIKVTFIF